jgi:hypothetical protein
MKDPLTPDPNADAPLSDDENALLNDMLQSGLPRRDFVKMMAGALFPLPISTGFREIDRNVTTLSSTAN